MMPQHPVPQSHLQQQLQTQSQQMVLPQVQHQQQMQQSMMQHQQQHQMINQQLRPMGGLTQGSGQISHLQQRLTQQVRIAQNSSHIHQRPQQTGGIVHQMSSGQMLRMPNMASGGVNFMNRGPPPMYMSNSPNIVQNCSPIGPGGNVVIHSPASIPGFVQSPISQQPSPSSMGNSNRSGMVGMVASPVSNTSVSTPQNNETPGSQEDIEYLEKVKQLNKYIEPLRRMVARNGNEDEEKLSKMKKLLDLLSNPNKRMPIDTLKKCEAVLERINYEMEPTTSTATAALGSKSLTTSAVVLINPVLDAIMKLVKMYSQTPSLSFVPSVNHTLQRTFGPPLESIHPMEYGQTLLNMTKRKKTTFDDDNSMTRRHIILSEIAQLHSHFRVVLDDYNSSCSYTRLVCYLEDRDLPSVTPLTVTLSVDYPDSSPMLEEIQSMPRSVCFLETLDNALQQRLFRLSTPHTLSQLLNAWEIAVRCACSNTTSDN